jgi:glycosyltransferase involved in cell wall biosynthesis
MRILLISYYFPPCGGAAVQRWLRWLPELVKAGMDVTVVTTREGDYPETDDSLLELVPPEVKVIRTRTPSSGRLWKLLMGKGSRLPHGSLEVGKHDPFLKKALVWIRLNLIIPDLRLVWNPIAYRAAQRFILTHPTDLVITTAPPHSTQLVGLKLKRRYGLRWIADWRDPWSGIHYYRLNPPQSWSLAIHKRLEAKVAEGADLNLVVSRSIAEQLPPGRKEVVYNGFDADRMDRLRVDLKDSGLKGDGSFRIRFIGQLTAGQALDGMLDAVSQAMKDKSFRLEFIGTRLSGEQLALIDERLPVKAVQTGFLPHDEALKAMLTCDLLVLLINYYEGAEGMLTTKLFEYLGSGTPILALGPRGGEAEELITRYGAGAYFDNTEIAEAAAFVRELADGSGQSKGIRDRKALSSQHQALRLPELLRDKKAVDRK